MKMCVFDRKKKCTVQIILQEQFGSKTIRHTPQFIKEYCDACLTNQLLTRFTSLERLIKQSFEPVLIVKTPEKRKTKQKVNKEAGE